MKIIKIYTLVFFATLFACNKNKKTIETTAKNNSISSTAIQAQVVRPTYAIKAPDFTLRTIDGELFTLSKNRGKVILLNFWGTWCGPCLQEIPDFNKLYNKYRKNGLEIVGVTLASPGADNSDEYIQKFMNYYKMNYTILTDINGFETQVVTSEYGRALNRAITGVPTTLIIDREGYIVKGYLGPRDEKTFYNDLKPYLSS